MVKKILSVAMFGAFALSGCSAPKAEVTPVVEVKAPVAPVVIEKVTPTVEGVAKHVPFSEMMR